MSDANKKLIQRGFDAFAQGDMEAMSEVLSPTVIWHTPGNNILAGDRRGLEETLSLFAQIGQETGGQISQEIHAILADDEHAVALVNSSITRNDKTVEGSSVFVFHVSGGQVSECWAHNSEQAALDDLWS
ncbi:MAG: nuclear transport factor 2 family protein [Acidimicrobiia bacterium]